MKTLRLGIYGTENSHAIQACDCFNVRKTIPAVQVAVLCPGPGDTLAHCREIAKNGMVPTVVEKFEQMLEMVDAVIIMNRHGKYHTAPARLALSRHIATFVDKPLTCSVSEAQELIDLAHLTGTWLSSWSTLWHTSSFKTFVENARRELGPLQIGAAAGPCDLDSEYGGIFFYGVHTVEMALQGFGYDVKTLSAMRSAYGAVATLSLASGTLVTLHFIKPYVFQMLAHGEKGSKYQVIDMSDGYDQGFQAMIEGIRSGVNPLTPEQLIKPVQVLAALEQALTTGLAVTI